MEVYLHNPWLTYGIGLHRIREAGLGTEFMDDLDEKPFSLQDIRDFCLEFFVGKNNLSLRNPKIDFKGFIEDLQTLVDKEQLVWNPVKNKLCPWVDVNKIKIMFARKKEPSGQKASFERRNTYTLDDSDTGRAKPRSGNRSGNLYASMQNDFNASMPGGFNRSTSNPNPDVTSKGNTNSSNSNPPPANLKEVIQQWSHVAPTYKKLKPLQDLLVGVPNLFPPINTHVETHEYYFKWKEFSEDAFSGESGDELKELLRRASRKSKLFLHPDKLPKDLTERQDELFKAIWNVIQESEAATL
jgi:hypothetical protein